MTLEGSPTYRESRVDRPSAIAAAISLWAVAPLLFLVMPVYVGALADDLGMSTQRIGSIASIEMLGLAVASFLAVLWIRRWSWRTVSWASIVTLVAANLVSIAAEDHFGALLAIRILTGMAAGSMMSIAIAAIGDTENPDRFFGLAIVVQVIIAGLALYALPFMVAKAGVSGVFVVLAGVATLPVFILRWLPSQGKKIPDAGTGGSDRRALAPLWGLAGCMVYFVAQTSVWAFLERMGVESGLSATFIGTSLGFAMFAGLLGALIASLIADRVHRLVPLVITVIGEIAVLTVLKGDMLPYVYLGGATLYQIFWNLSLPFQMGLVARVDTTGRFVVLITAFQGVGIAIAPALTAQLISGDSYIAVNYMGGIMVVISLLLFLPIVGSRSPGRNSGA